MKTKSPIVRKKITFARGCLKENLVNAVVFRLIAFLILIICSCLLKKRLILVLKLPYCWFCWYNFTDPESWKYAKKERRSISAMYQVSTKQSCLIASPLHTAYHNLGFRLFCLTWPVVPCRTPWNFLEND